MNLSYREKSLWVSLLVSFIVASYFSGSIIGLLSAGPDADIKAVSILVFKIVVALVVIEIILNILLAMEDQDGAEEPEDEREKGFRYKANEWGYWVLSVGVIGCIAQQLIAQQLVTSGVTELNNDTHTLIALGAIELKIVVIFWFSEIVRFAAQIYHYRKDA